MARPLKVGIDYFPLDCTPDRKTKMLIRKFGLIGEAVYITLLKTIYSEGYYLKVCDDFVEDFCLEYSMTESLFNDILEFLFHKEFFISSLYESSKVLTSYGIQRRFIEATKKRKDKKIDDTFLVNDDGNLVNVVHNSVNDVHNPVNVVDNTQSKLKESKVKKSKGITTCDRFEKWWNIYDKKRDKKNVFQKWNRLSEISKNKCLEVVVDYVESTPEVQFRKDPSTYLNRNSWEDELLQPSQNKPQFQIGVPKIEIPSNVKQHTDEDYRGLF